MAPCRGRERAFTLIEILTVLVIMLIFSTLFISAYSYLQNRADRASCINNLQSLYTAGSAYLVDHDYIWPQIPTAKVTDPNYALAWEKVFAPYQVSPINWVCPTTQRLKGNPNVMNPKTARIDYTAMPFNAERYMAYRWPTQPWFAESSAGHGDGPMLVLANGQVMSLNQVALMQTTISQ